MGCGAVRGTEAYSTCGGCDGRGGCSRDGGLRLVLGGRCGERERWVWELELGEKELEL